MTSAQLIAELKRRNHSHLYHACTLGTFRSYAQLGAYRSRHAVRAANLTLTPQVSDRADEALDIFDHLFLNIFDQHGDVHNGKSVTGLNKYGPLLMVFDVEGAAPLKGELSGYRIEITDQSYDPTVHDIVTMDDFRSGTFKDPASNSTDDAPSRRPGTRGPNMCVHVADQGVGIPFQPYLHEVVIDELPARYAGLQEAVEEEVVELLKEAAPEAVVRTRKCIDRCGCRDAYGRVLSERDIERFFYETNTHVYPKYLKRSL